MRFTLLFSAFCLCASLQAQTEENLKEFINKNNIALHSVQKNMSAQNISDYSTVFKNLLIKQESAVKVYSSNKELSYSLAHAVRQECLIFFKKYYSNSVAYYEITADEQKLLSSKQFSDEKILSDNEIKIIKDLDVNTAQSFNNLSLTIQ